MKTIEFVYADKGNSTYIAVKNRIWRSHENHSGSYVKADVAEGLLECLKKVSSSLENMIDCACNDDCRPKAVLHLEIAKKIIKQAEEAQDEVTDA